jgi:hypothetical protein
MTDALTCWAGTGFGAEMVAFPLACGGAAGTDPNDFGASALTAGAGAGDDEIVADASSIDPNVTEEPERE